MFLDYIHQDKLEYEAYGGGKIKVTSKDIHAELTLKWIPNSGSISTSIAEQKSAVNTQETTTNDDNN